MSQLITPEQCVKAIERTCSGGTGPVVVCLFTTGSRHRFQRDVLQIECRFPLLVHILDDRLFDTPNAVATDLVNLMERRRDDIEKLLPPTVDGPLAVLVLSKEDIDLVVADSPVMLPSWFRLNGGVETDVPFVGLLDRSLEPLDSACLQLEAVANLLLQMETQIQSVLGRRIQTDFCEVSSLLEYLWPGTSGREECEKRLDQAHARLVQCREQGYRPKKNGGTITEELWQNVYGSSVSHLGEGSKKLAVALGIVEEGQSLIVRESISAVLVRPTDQALPAAQRLGRNLLVTAFAACQLITVSHHAVDYAEYEIPLLRSVSFDLRLVLQELVSYLLEG